VISGVAADTKDSCLMPRFFSYHVLVAGMERTVRTRWSREVIFAAGFVDEVDILLVCEMEGSEDLGCF
jgi:hypothetical protein